MACRLSARFSLDQIIQKLLEIFKDRYPNEKLDDPKLNETINLVLTGKLEDPKSSLVGGAAGSASVTGSGAAIDASYAGACSLDDSTAGLFVVMGSGESLAANSILRDLLKPTVFREDVLRKKKVKNNLDCLDFALPSPVNMTNFEEVKNLLLNIISFRRSRLINEYKQAQLHNRELFRTLQLRDGSLASRFKKRQKYSENNFYLQKEDLEFACDSYSHHHNLSAAFNSLLHRLESHHYPQVKIKTNSGSLALIVQELLTGSSSGATSPFRVRMEKMIF